MTQPVRHVPEDAYTPTDRPKVYKPAKIEVEWNDAYLDPGWKGLDRYTESRLRPSFTMGYLISDSEKDIRVVQSITPHEGTATEGMIIPKAMVINIRVLEPYEELPDPEEEDDMGTDSGREHRQQS